MSIAVAKVINVTGSVQVLNTQTQEMREVTAGSELFFNEVIITADEATIAMDMIDGKTIALGSDTRFAIDNDVIPAEAVQDLTADNAITFESLQRAVIEGRFDSVVQDGDVSPEQAAALQNRIAVLARSAEQVEEPSSSNQEGAELSRIADEGLVTAGYDTGTRAIAFERDYDDTGRDTPLLSTIAPAPLIPQVIIKLVAADATGNPLKDGAGNYLVANEVKEGGTAYYVALAFSPNSTQFNDATKLTNQVGTVDFTFTDATATRDTALGAPNGTNDYLPQPGLVTIALGDVVSVDALDDFMADNGENFVVTIGNYQAGSPSYAAVTVRAEGVTTTITDNSKPIDENTPHNPNDTNNHTEEANKEIVLVKLFAADANGEVLKDGSGHYLVANTVNEGNDAKYVAYAFEPGTTVFNDATRLAEQFGQVGVQFADSTATGVSSQTVTNGTQDYNNTPQTITLGQAFSTSVFNDVMNEGDETYTVTITANSYQKQTNGAGYESVEINVQPVTTTIKDFTSTVFVKIESLVGEVWEGTKLKYKLTIVDEQGDPVTIPNGKTVTVALNYQGEGSKHATSGLDYTPVTTVTIAGGTSSQEFEVQTIDDYFAEGDEGLKISIGTITDTNSVFESIKAHTTANGAVSNLDTVSGVIKDNSPNVMQPTDENNTDNATGSYDADDTVYVKITGSPTVIEGNNLTHTVSLVDKNGNAVTVPAGETITVTISYTNDGTEDADFIAPKTTSVTLSGGASSATITHQTIDDFVADDNESYTATITHVAQANNTYENVAIGDVNGQNTSVTGTIQDGVTLGTPENAAVDEDHFDVTDSQSKLTVSASLNITAPGGDNAYKLLFDPSVEAKDPDTDSVIPLTSNGQAISFDYSTEGKIIATRAGDNKKVFEITLNKNNAGGGDDNYTYTQYENIDHPDANVDDNIVLTFGYKITDQGQTSQVQPFTVTVNDSMPSATPQTIAVDEDGSKLIIISNESFLNGEITLNNGVDASSSVANGASIDIYDADKNDVIGSLKNNGNGTLTFTPIADYSGATAGFTYSVTDSDGDTATAQINISVTPKSDAPTIANGGATTWEDTAVTINLKAPVVKDATDKNGATAGDYPEKLGLITLNNMASGVQILKGTDDSVLWTSGGTSNKLYILLSDGEHTQDAIDAYTANQAQANYLTMTKAEFEALKVNPVAQSHKNIDIKMSVTSYEVDASGNQLPDVQTVGTNGSTADKTFHVEVKAVTDDIALTFDDNTNGTIDQTERPNDTYTATARLTEGDGVIDLQAILTATAGGTDDLDGSELIKYKFETIPVGTVVQFGTATATANASGVAEVTLKSAEYTADPVLKMTLPEHFSGEVKAKITLIVQDRDDDSSHTAGVKTQVVYFNVDVNPVADLATLQVKQSIGYEDAGRSGGNTSAKDATIDQPANGIPLHIKVSSSDTDGSESFNVRIADIPVGAAIYYNGVAQSINAGEIIINDFDNNAPLYFIPPHNSDVDVTLKVNAQTVDTVTIDGVTVTNTSAWLTTDKDIDVIVKGVADVPVGTELKGFDINGDAGSDYNLVLNENTDLDGQGNKFDLKDVYQAPATLNSYDSDSETLSVVISGLTPGFGVEGASMIGAGKWTFLATNINDIKITTPSNFSGEAGFTLTYVTTEREGDSKTHDPQTVKIFVKPQAEAEIKTSSTGNEDTLFKVDLGVVHQNGDTNETLEQVRIKASDVDGQAFTLYMDSNGTTLLSSFAKTSIGGTDYYVLTAAQADSLYAKNTTEHNIGAGSFTFKFGYTVRDTEADKNTFNEKVVNDIDYTLTIKAVTDTPTVTLETLPGGTGYTVDSTKITVLQPDITFTVPVKLTTPDQDGSESVVKYVITGVPMGVEVVGGTYYGYAGSPHNGIWVLDIADQAINDGSGHTQNIQFKVNQGADFENRDMTIKAFNQDNGADLNSGSVTFTLEKGPAYGPGVGTGTPPQFELSAKPLDILEDTAFNLGSALNVAHNGGSVSGNYVITITDLPSGASISGHDYSYEEAGVMRYVVTGSGNAADAVTRLSSVTMTPPANINDSDDKTQSMTFTATIATNDSGTFYQGNTVNYAEHVLPVTDDMTIAINASDTQEDTATNFTVTLSNTVDHVTEIIGNKLYIKLTENYEVGESATGELWYNGAKLTATQNINGSDYFVVDVAGYVMGDPIGFTFKPGEDRHGQVSFDVLVQNKEGHDWDTNDHDTAVQNSTASKAIQVIPVIDGLVNDQANDVTGNESTGTDSNRIKMDFGATLSDPSESISSMTLDKIPNGFLIFYGSDANNLTMATNIGKSDTYTGTFELNPNGTSQLVGFNQWLVPLVGGQIPSHVWIQAPQNWSGNINGVALNLFGIKDGNQTMDKAYTFDVNFVPVADGLTIDPTLTFGTTFNWIDLKLNANMMDVDGSETMSIQMQAKSGSTALSDGMLFRLNDGTWLKADFNNGVYTLKDVAYNQVNNIQILYGSYDGTLEVKAKTEEVNSASISAETAISEFVFKSTGSNTTLALPGSAGSYNIQFSHGGSFDGNGIYSGTVTIQTGGNSYVLPSGVKSLEVGGQTYSLQTVYNDKSASNSDGVFNGIVIDGIIEGMLYQTSSGLSGLTDANGGFQYREGDSVTFSVGGVVIGTATPEDLALGAVFLQDLADVARTDLNSDYVQKMAVFLQSLDSEGLTEDGLQISQQARDDLAEVSLNLSTATMAEVNAVLIAAGYTPVSVEEAMEHVREMLIAHTPLTEEDFDPLDNVTSQQSLDEALAMIDDEVVDDTSGSWLEDEALLIDETAFDASAQTSDDTPDLPGLDDIFEPEAEDELPLGGVESEQDDAPIVEGTAETPVFIDDTPPVMPHPEEQTDF